MRGVAEADLDNVREKLVALEALAASLQALMTSCGAAGAGGTSRDCAIFSDFDEPAGVDGRW